MAGAVIGALRVVLGIDTAQFEAGSRRAEARAGTLGDRIGRSMQTATGHTSALKSALVGLGGALALKELAAATQRAFDYADSIQDLADRSGATTKSIQEFRYAAQLSGSSVEVADAAIEKFARTLGLAQQGSDAQVALFKSLGVTSKDFDTALRQTMDGLAKLPSVQQRAATGFQVFGKSSATLTGLLGQGSKGFDNLAAEAQELGIVLKDDVIRNAGGANDKLDTLKMILNAQFANAVIQNANSLVAMADGLMTLTSAILKFMSAHPEQALAIIGGIAGSRAGPIGAAVGTVTGYVAGKVLGQNAEDANTDLAFRARKFKQAVADRRASKAAAARMKKSGSLIDIRRDDGDGVGTAQEVIRQHALYQKALAASKGQGAAGTGGRLPTVGNAAAASAGKKAASDAAAAARKAKADQERASKEAKRNDEAFQSDLSHLNVEQLGLRQAITTDLRTVADLEHRRLAAEAAAAEADIANKVADGKLTEAKANQLRLVQERNTELQHTAVNWKLEDDLVREQAQAREDMLTLAADEKRGALAAARTQAERRRLQLELLDIEYERQRAALEDVLALHTTTDVERETAQARLGQLDAAKRIDQADVKRGTQGPLAQYLDSLPRDAAEVNEAYQQIAADGLKSLNDGLAEAIMGSKSLADVFKNMANAIINDLVRIAIQQAIIKPLANSLFGGGDSTSPSGGLLGKLFGGKGGGIGGSLGALLGKGNGIVAGDGSIGPFINTDILGKAGSGIRLPGLARGGSFRVGGNTGLDRNILSLNGVPTARVNYGERVHVTPANDIGRGTPSVVQLVVGEGQIFEPRVQSISGNVAVTTVSNASRSRERLNSRTLVR